MRVAKRVFFYERGTDRAPDVIGALEAARKLRLGQLIVRASNPRTGVTAVESSGVSIAASTLGARAGSFGIISEHLPSGHTCFRHHNPEIDQVAA